MKNILAATLAALCASALASPSTNVADFDIEGFKLGMNEAQLTALLKEKCADGQFEKQEEKEYDMLVATWYSCHLQDTQEKIGVLFVDKTLTIFAMGRQIKYPANLSAADKQAMNENVYGKLLEKYGTPTHKGVQDKKASEIELLDSIINEKQTMEKTACWGDCRVDTDKQSLYYQIRAGKDFYAVAAMDIDDYGIEIYRGLVDVAGVAAVEADYEKAVEAAKNRVAEEAKKQAQQATDNIKF